METELETLSSVFGPEKAAKMVNEGVSSEGWNEPMVVLHFIDPLSDTHKICALCRRNAEIQDARLYIFWNNKWRRE